MPRHGQAPSTNIRNRYRINNKSRLKVIRGNIDTDPVILNEDEEKNRLMQSVAGVDQEDANEHHLQAVLSAAALRNTSHSSSLKSEKKDREAKEDPTAFIPVPDHNGVVDDHEALYPVNRWKDPVAYIQSTFTVEDSIDASLSNGVTYVMDEKDFDWLSKNNEEARGEGTSAQGAVLNSRSSPSGAKAKGKQPDSVQPVVITEDQFELVMGLFEKTANEKTAFLHHSLETGMAFPPFSDYQDIFSNALPPTTFTSFKVPSWLPTSPELLQMAKVVYPYWRERRIERGGHPIIPTLNFDESDTLNEGYICFRRRDVKTARKTRQAQVLSSDKLARLQAEFMPVMQLANMILKREELKREVSKESQGVWDRRREMVEVRVKAGARGVGVGEKGDDELLVDKEKERVKKESARVKIPAKAGADTSSQQGGSNGNKPAFISPKDRLDAIRTTIETQLQRAKESDQHWEDVVDTGYVPPPTSYASRLFKYITPPISREQSPAPTPDDDSSEATYRRAVRLRIGRCGRRFVDRRPPVGWEDPSSISFIRGRKRPLEDDDDNEDDSERQESERRLKERWRFDSDDNPPYGPKGSDEQDRVLVDEYDPRLLRHVIDITKEQDYNTFIFSDPTISATRTENLQHIYPSGRHLASQQSSPQKLQPQPLQARPANPQPTPAPASPASRGGVYLPVSSALGVQIAPGRPQPLTPQQPQQSPPQPLPVIPTPVSQPMMNGVVRPAINIPYIVKPESEPQSQEVVEIKPTLVPSNTNTPTLPALASNDFKLKMPPVRDRQMPLQKPPSSRVQRPPSAMGSNAKVN